MTNSVTEILAVIRQSLTDAEEWAMHVGGDHGYFVESAFIKTRLFLEAAGLGQALKAVEQLQQQAENDYGAFETNEVGDPYLVWGRKLRQYLTAIEVILGEPKAGTVSKDVVDILRATQYSITDKNCFAAPPANERHVHVRIEGVLRCVFPDLINKPRITKQIKHFEPDTGLPGIRTLIEYKFISSVDEAKRVCEEVLADTRGYVSTDWDTFIYVLYETKRIKSEKQWNQLLKTSGVGTNTKIIVIHGEERAEKAAKSGHGK